MNRDDSRLLRHLTTAVAVKLAVLAVLWWTFVRDSSVDAGSEQTAAHLVAPTTPSATRQPNSPTTRQEHPQ
ncbi:MULTISPECIES: cytochrome oxidase putative small subunit CydP [unclassified Methylibium]|uniref:cytochrome oxidase putative small subunit CydP n=1 Tax=unclassified Methylibium TaxID=2633235 RepID=UPI0003F44D4C|nr:MULTISPECIES: cytochrome oxidase putative small subunit CydP [unclassified Methylibium]EWS55471.1 hypothetical protein X551_01723 [Methylibium sp. T29]EWS61229.1 hypothetical protein Y694_00988 [Methylibium sp. T29-B]